MMSSRLLPSLLRRRTTRISSHLSKALFSSWYPDSFDLSNGGESLQDAQRVWKSSTTENDKQSQHYETWTSSILQKEENIHSTLEKIGLQELQGGRMAQRQLGVLREDAAEDMRLLMENYTVPSLASALRDREELLQTCAELMRNKEYSQVAALLQPFQHVHVKKRRLEGNTLSLSSEFTPSSLETIRKALARMPRRVVHAHDRRAGVVLAICNVAGIPSVLLELRSPSLRAHPDEVCLPGGMVCNNSDQNIVNTCLREMQEEVGGLGDASNFVVLGVLRCNWGEVHHLVGLAVTPLVCFIGDLTDSQLTPNPDEVAEVFTIPLSALLQKRHWIHREGFAPIFVGGPHVIWGLSGYILERFAKDILSQYHGG